MLLERRLLAPGGDQRRECGKCPRGTVSYQPRAGFVPARLEAVAGQALTNHVELIERRIGNGERPAASIVGDPHVQAEQIAELMFECGDIGIKGGCGAIAGSLIRGVSGATDDLGSGVTTLGDLETMVGVTRGENGL